MVDKQSEQTINTSDPGFSGILSEQLQPYSEQMTSDGNGANHEDDTESIQEWLTLDSDAGDTTTSDSGATMRTRLAVSEWIKRQKFRKQFRKTWTPLTTHQWQRQLQRQNIQQQPQPQQQSGQQGKQEEQGDDHALLPAYWLKRLGRIIDM